MEISGNILIVDDDRKVRDILQRSLTKQGHDVRVAVDGKGALASFDDNGPDLVVLDVMLPDMDGREVLKTIRKKDKRTPVLLLSASSNLETRISGLDDGADDFLEKPFSLREFNMKVERALGFYHQTRELERKKKALETDITRRQKRYVKMNKELKRQLLSMKTLFTVNQDLNRHLDIEELVNSFCLTIMGELQISNMAFFVVGSDKDTHFTLAGLKGFDRKRVSDLKLAREGKFVKWLMHNHKPRKIVRSEDVDWVRRLPDIRLAVFEYITPIVVKQRLEGIVLTGPKLANCDYSAFDLDMLMSVCTAAGVGLDNARLFREIQNTYLSTVKALVSIVEAKDAYTKGHTERVADYSTAVGRKMNLQPDQIRDIAFGAVLHDIGKLMVYEKVLNKQDSLSEDEWEILRKHPETGAEIIQNIAFLSGTVPIVRHHHERYDGKGYPDGLKGEDIPLGARIISVADSFDAMTTDRPYRRALSWETAMETLTSQAGRQFDPNVVKSFIELLEKDRFSLKDMEKYPVLVG